MSSGDWDCVVVSVFAGEALPKRPPGLALNGEEDELPNISEKTIG